MTAVSTLQRYDPMPEPVLTEQQLRVLKLAADGKGNELIGCELGMRPMYVQKIMVKIMDALGASSRTAAVAIALRRGLIT